ncbi:MAG: GNAT family N-acetyltransferase [Methanobacteriota archaeon]
MAVSGVVVRNFDKTKDIDEFVKFYNAAHSDHPKHKDLSVEIAQRYIFGAPNYDGSSHFLALKDSKIVGSVKGETFAGTTGVIGMIVRPENRHLGVEDALHQSVMRHFQQNELKDARVLVDSSFPKLVEFYNRQGFEAWKVNYAMSSRLSAAMLASPQLPIDYAVEIAMGDSEKGAIRNVLDKGFSDADGGAGEILHEFDRMSAQKDFDPTGLLVARNDAGVVGVSVNFIHPAIPTSGYVVWLAVLPGERGKGLGKALLLAGMRWMKEKGIETAELNVDLKNPGALKLYKNCGFVVSSETIIMNKARLGS